MSPEVTYLEYSALDQMKFGDMVWHLYSVLVAVQYLTYPQSLEQLRNRYASPLPPTSHGNLLKHMRKPKPTLITTEKKKN